MNRNLITTISLAVILTAQVALAQDTSGVNQSAASGTVIKGKAPVAKEILHVRFPKPQSFKLKNGLSVYVLEDHRVPIVRFSLELRAGSVYESKEGVASATAALLSEGTQSKTFAQISDETESSGMSLNANAGLDTATLTAAGLSESTDALLALMTDVLLHPSFPADRLDRYKSAQRNGLSQRRTNPTALVAELQSQVFYGGTKFARPTPTSASIQAISRDDLVQFYQQYYRPGGAILGVTGDIDAKQLKAKLEAALANWKVAEALAELPKADFQPKQVAHIYLIDRPGSAQSVVQFGSLGVKQNDPDFIALTVANRVLGGGSSGRLFQNIREKKGYTYGAYSTLSAGKWPGIWGANASVRTEVTEPAVGEFFNEFKRLQNEPVPEKELALAKRSLVGGFARTLESNEGILARSLELVQNDLPSNYWDTYPKLIAAVTPADIMRVAKKYLGGGNVQLLVVGERKRIETGLAKYGTVEVIDPNKISSVGTR
jgi:predicted Zn-dependent peptidase